MTDRHIGEQRGGTYVDTTQIDTNQPDADALVLFGATGDLAKRKLFPSLYHLERSGHADRPGDRCGTEQIGPTTTSEYTHASRSRRTSPTSIRPSSTHSSPAST